MRIAVVALALILLINVPGQAEDDVIIIIRRTADDHPAATATGPAGVTPMAEHRGDAYRVMFEHPEQTFLDSNIGPVPLYTDVVFDANGQPKPRFPHYYAKQLYDNPTEETARAYLEQGMARMRRIKEVTNLVEITAAKNGYVVPSDFAADPTVAEEPDQYSVTRPNKSDDPKDWGQPILTPEQAVKNGLDKADIPLTPRFGYDVEVWYVWDYRDERSVAALTDFSAFGWDLIQTEAKLNIKTICLDTDAKKLVQMIDYLKWRGVLMHKLENYTDYTGIRRSFKITSTPTYIFIDKRRGRIDRWEGVTTLEDLRTRFMDFLALEGDQRVWKPTAAWFVNDYDRLRYRDLNRVAVSSTGGVPTPGNATPVQAPSLPVLPWRP